MRTREMSWRGLPAIIRPVQCHYVVQFALHVFVGLVPGPEPPMCGSWRLKPVHSRTRGQVPC